MKRTKLGLTVFLSLGILFMGCIFDYIGLKGSEWLCQENVIKVSIVFIWVLYVAPYLYIKFTVGDKQDGV